jgi:Uma2 family endonuclease
MLALPLPFELNLREVHLTDEQFFQLCINNPNLRIERSLQGTLIFMPPIGGESGRREASLITDLTLWNRQTGLGEVFSSSTSFQLPGGGDRSPDAAWVERSRWQALTPDQRQKFPPLAPDFVIELRSRTDSLSTLQAKMQEYLDAGVRLAWLLNPQDQQVEIYRQGQPLETRPLPADLSGEEVLPGFLLRLELFTA